MAQTRKRGQKHDWYGTIPSFFLENKGHPIGRKFLALTVAGQRGIPPASLTDRRYIIP